MGKQINKQTKDQINKHEFTTMCIYMFSEFLKNALQNKYKNVTVPTTRSVGVDSDKPESLEDVFIEVHLQKHSTESLPENISLLDRKEKETQVQTSDAIPLDHLFRNIDGDKIKTATKVLLQGRPGVGKSTLVKYAANQWAKGSLWDDTKYTFLVSLKELELPPNQSWSLSNLLFDGLIPPEHHVACLDVITKRPQEVLVILDGFDERRCTDKQQEQNKNEADLAKLLSRIINNGELPGAKVLVSSRPTKQLPVKAFNHTVELRGFTEEMINEYVDKTYTKEQKGFIMKHLHADRNMAGLCQMPLQCTFVCASLADRHSCGDDAGMAVVKTTTDLYVQATIQMARKLHPHLKYSKEETDLDELFNTIKTPLVKHAELARYGIMSSPPKFIFSKDDLGKFKFDESDRNCGFLVESRIPDPRFKGTTQQRWEFTHTTMQEFFAAVGMLRSGDNVWMNLQEGMVERLKTMLSFLAGLLGDRSHKYYVEHLVAGGAALNPDNTATALQDMLTMTRTLAKMMNDDAMIIATVYETQNSDMVDIVPTEIAARNMSVTDMCALVWLLENDNFRITSLRYVEQNAELTSYLTDYH